MRAGLRAPMSVGLKARTSERSMVAPKVVATAALKEWTMAYNLAELKAKMKAAVMAV